MKSQVLLRLILLFPSLFSYVFDCLVHTQSVNIHATSPSLCLTVWEVMKGSQKTFPAFDHPCVSTRVHNNRDRRWRTYSSKHYHVFCLNFFFVLLLFCVLFVWFFVFLEKGAWWEECLKSVSFLQVRMLLLARGLASFCTQPSFIGFTECVVEKGKKISVRERKGQHL